MAHVRRLLTPATLDDGAAPCRSAKTSSIQDA
jgi:hypothetical protein